MRLPGILGRPDRGVRGALDRAKEKPQTESAAKRHPVEFERFLCGVRYSTSYQATIGKIQGYSQDEDRAAAGALAASIMRQEGLGSGLKICRHNDGAEAADYA